MTLITALLGRVKGWAIAALALLGAIGTAFMIGRSKGRTAAENEAAATKAKSDMAAMSDALDAVKERNDVEDEIARQPAGTSADRLRNDWSRD